MKINRARPMSPDDFDSVWRRHTITNVIVKPMRSILNDTVSDCYFIYFKETKNYLILREENPLLNILEKYSNIDTDQWLGNPVELRRDERPNREDNGTHGIIDLRIPLPQDVSHVSSSSSPSSSSKKRYWRRGHWVNDDPSQQQEEYSEL